MIRFLCLRQAAARHLRLAIPASASSRFISTATITEHSDDISQSLPTNERVRAVRSARPFSDFLTDTHNRQHDYLRISLTERCNLRCLYCMPEEGVELSPSKDILTTAEIIRLSSLFVSQGVTKIRLTGGEPTVRKDILPLMRQIGDLRQYGLKELALTTNGISLHRKLDDMVESGLTGVNISLDTLDPLQYQILTRRPGYDAVMKSINRVKTLNAAGAKIKLKINCVVMRGLNDHQILPFVDMTQHDDLEVRFIEYMPFGGNKWSERKMMSYADMLDIIRAKYPAFSRLQDARNDTSKTWQVPGFAGRVGFITSMTHNFCGTCNRLRITSDGNLKVCLHGNAEVSLRDMLRSENAGEPMDEAAFDAIRTIEASRSHGDESSAMDQRLLNVIGAAVKRKKAEHAGIGQLEKMKNRPMILIDDMTKKWQTNEAMNVRSAILFNYHMATIHQPSSNLYATQFSRQTSRAYSSHVRHNRHGTTLNPMRKRSFASTSRPSERQGLSHVNAHGQAHMVDVGQKESSRRVAIAVSTVMFTNDLPVTMINENTNRKGDVLGVARIAGIMAAKRTADLIPLCHPIAIKKVELDIKILSSGEDSPFGAASIQALVECSGQTGVEMEALTAANVAALTVYDMCKAVDRSMTIDDTRVVWKSGGKSGTHVDERWASSCDEDFFVKRSLDWSR